MGPTGQSDAEKSFVSTEIAESESGRFICYPELGGRLDGLQLPIQNAPETSPQHWNILRNLGSAAAIKRDVSYNNTLLFPFVNRLHEGCYNFNNQRFAFPINDRDTGNALHGFLYQEALECHQAESDGVEPNSYRSLQLGFSYSGERDYYPYETDLRINYFFDENDGFNVDIKIQNTGNAPVPLATGWHPYFDFGHSIDELELELPAMQKILIDHRMIPTGRRQAFHRFLKTTESDLQLGREQYDTCFLLNSLTNGNSSFKSLIYSPVRDFTLIIEQSENLPYMQLFTPGDRQSLAVEPVSANINALQNGQGLSVLEPGESETFSIRLSLISGRVSI